MRDYLGLFVFCLAIIVMGVMMVMGGSGIWFDWMNWVMVADLIGLIFGVGYSLYRLYQLEKR